MGECDIVKIVETGLQPLFPEQIIYTQLQTAEEAAVGCDHRRWREEKSHIDKVELVSRTIDRTHNQVITTTDFIQRKVVEPARELAAIMAGFRRGLEVLVAPIPKPVNQTYGEDEMFIG